MHQLAGLYPCGEGAGYAGGIMSAAVDGLRVARASSAGMHRQKGEKNSMNDRENDTMRENEGRQVQQELENQLRAFGDTVSDAFAHGFEGKGEDIGDRAYGVGRAAVNAANFGLGEAAKAFRSSREEYYRSRQNAQNTKKQGLNEDCINAQTAGVSGWFRQMFGKAETTPADEIRASAKKRYSAGCALLAVGITFTVIFGITAVSCLGAAGLFTPNAAVLQALLQDSFMAENAAAMGSFALGAVRITGWCFAAVTAVFVWMITAGASRLKPARRCSVWPRQQKALTAKRACRWKPWTRKRPVPQAGAQIHPQWLAECMGGRKSGKALPDC